MPRASSRPALPVTDPIALRSQRWLAACLAPATRHVTDPQHEIPLLLRIARGNVQINRLTRELTALESRARASRARLGADDDSLQGYDDERTRISRLLIDARRALNADIDAISESIDLERTT